MADDVLIDMIERSGIDLGKLEPLIAQQYEDVQNLPGNCHVGQFATSQSLIYSNS